jgi:hypothetical protein
MSGTNHWTFPVRNKSEKQFLHVLLRFLAVAIVALIAGLLPTRVQGQDDDYLKIHALIQRADLLNDTKQTNSALPKYKEAQVALRNFQANNPNWNKRIVSYRMNYLSAKIAALKPPSTEAAEESVSANRTASRPGNASTTQVKLLNPGSEPRKILRLHSEAGSKQTLDMIMKMVMEMKADETPVQSLPIPAITMSMDVTTKSVSAEGDITYEMVFGDTTVADDTNVPPQMVQAMKASVAGLKGMTGTGIISSRGVNKKVDLKMQGNADPQLSQVMDQMKESFNQFSATLPEEAVGSGAKWEIKMPVKSQGMTIDQVTTCELVSMDGDRVEMKNTVNQHAANQKIQSPAMPGLKVDLTSMSGNATGTSVFDLSQLLPVQSQINTHNDMVMGVNGGNQKQSMNMKMNMKIDMDLQLKSK